MNRKGIAIVSVLLLMLAVFTLGIGALVLSRLNLNISENVRSNSIVRYNNESGVDAAMVALEQWYVANGVFPVTGASTPDILADLSVVAEGDDPTFTVYDYVRHADDVAAFRAISTLVNGAEYVTETLVGIEFTSGTPGSSAPSGLVSEGVVTINGSSTYIDAGIHGNEGFDIKGNVTDDFFICVDGADADDEPDRDPVTGLCTNTVSVDLSDAPVSGSPGATTCEPNALCDSGVPIILIDPVDVEPGYADKRDAAIDEISQGAYSSTLFFQSDGTTPMDCDYITTTVITFADLQSEIAALKSAGTATPTVCLEGASTLSVPNGATIEDVNIVAQGNIDFSSSVTITDANLISMTGGIFDDTATGPGSNVDATISDSRIFSEKSIGIHGTNALFSGITTIASNGDVTVNGGAEAVIDAGEPSVGLVLIAEGDVTVNGSSQWYLVASAGGTFVQNGTSFIFGGVEAEGDLTINGGIDIDSGLAVSNPAFDGEPTPFLAIISRR